MEIENIDYPSDADWLAYVDTTPIESPEREFKRVMILNGSHMDYTTATARLRVPEPGVLPITLLYLFGKAFRFYPH